MRPEFELQHPCRKPGGALICYPNSGEEKTGSLGLNSLPVLIGEPKVPLRDPVSKEKTNTKNKDKMDGS